ncbi:MAG: carbohydrate-binding family 9-like protein [Gemmatimonadetes bacterium]|nr:MAG: carbohydrate-binding family 9-like protein [Gemmatimonadota bacterium]
MAGRCTHVATAASWAGTAALLAGLGATVGAPAVAASQAAGGERTPPAYTAVWTPRAPVLDGVLEEEVWAAAPWTAPFVDIRGEGHPAPAHETVARMLWDDTHFYVGAWLAEPHLWGTLVERDAIIYRDDDFEVFLDPDGDGLAYYELEINVLGTEFDLFLDRPYSRGGRAYIEWNMPGLRSAVRLEGTPNDPADRDRGWWVEIAIPWRDLVPPDSVPVPTGAGAETSAGVMPGPGLAPRDGDVWRVNFSRVDWPLAVVEGAYRKAAEPTPENRHPEHNWVWAPQGVIDMHLPEHWGFVTFRRRP